MYDTKQLSITITYFQSDGYTRLHIRQRDIFLKLQCRSYTGEGLQRKRLVSWFRLLLTKGVRIIALLSSLNLSKILHNFKCNQLNIAVGYYVYENQPNPSRRRIIIKNPLQITQRQSQEFGYWNIQLLRIDTNSSCKILLHLHPHLLLSRFIIVIFINSTIAIVICSKLHYEKTMWFRPSLYNTSFHLFQRTKQIRNWKGKQCYNRSI